MNKKIIKYGLIGLITASSIISCNNNNNSESNYLKNKKYPNITLNVVDKTDSSTIYIAEGIENVLATKTNYLDGSGKLIFEIDNGKEGFVHTEFKYDSLLNITEFESFSRYYDNENEKVIDITKNIGDVNIKRYEHYLPINLAEMDTADFKYFENKVHKKILEENIGPINN